MASIKPIRDLLALLVTIFMLLALIGMFTVVRFVDRLASYDQQADEAILLTTS